MCGIALQCSSRSPVELPEPLLELLRARGPDSFHILHHRAEIPSLGAETTSTSALYLTFVASVLGLRGDGLHPQPQVDSETVFAWNGEAWAYDDEPVYGNDTVFIFNQILATTRSVQGDRSHSGNIAQALGSTLGKVLGPFSFLFYDPTSYCVFYGRDLLGRRSLLHQDARADSIIISSTSAPEDTAEVWKEVDPHGIHTVQLQASGLRKGFFPWTMYRPVRAPPNMTP